MERIEVTIPIPRMDRLLEAGMSTVDLDARKTIYAQVQQLAADDLPYVSLWWVDNVAVMNRRLVGFDAYPNGSFRSLATLTLVGPAAAARRRIDSVINYLVRRLLALVPVALGVATLTFAIIHLVPGDPVVAMLGETAAPADIVGMRHQLGLDRPLLEQYAGYLGGLAVGDLGESTSYRKPVSELIAERFPATIELAAAGMLVAVLLAFPLGLIAGANPGGAGDLGAMGFAIVGISIPHIYLGPLLMILFSLDLRWLPLTGRGGIAHLVLPAVTLGTALAAILARMLRQSLIRVRESDYMRTALSKGLSARAALVRHGLKNALTSVVTIIGLQMGALLSGTLITEIIFSWPGIGRLLITAIGARDYPVVEGCVLTFAMTYVVVNMATDIVYAMVDPRVRIS